MLHCASLKDVVLLDYSSTCVGRCIDLHLLNPLLDFWWWKPSMTEDLISTKSSVWIFVQEFFYEVFEVFTVTVLNTSWPYDRFFSIFCDVFKFLSSTFVRLFLFVLERIIPN